MSDEVMLGYLRHVLRYIGDDPEREGLQETPERILRAWAEIFHGYQEDWHSHVKIFHEDHDQLVVLRGVEFYSMCEHHMLPFWGTTSIGYIPEGKVLGLSKLARIVECFARRLQVQERMTQQIAEAVQEAVAPLGVAVVVDGLHSCMAMRGIQKQRARMTTSAMLGVLRTDAAARAEAMQLLRIRTDHE